jgi:hypothetical protein
MISVFTACDRRARARHIASVRVLCAVIMAISCTPRAGSLRGTPAPARFPQAELPPGHKRVVFRWEYSDQALGARGEGAARVAGGFAIVVGDSISTPGGDDVRRYLPPPSFLWAALGRLAVPSIPDTVAKVDGNTLWADIGRNPTWRIAFVGDQLTRVERIVDGRRIEWVNRSGSEVRYRHERSLRSLTLRITSTDAAAPFDPTIWRR